MVKLKGSPQNGFFLPHHAVFKEASMTTKVRIVFDASAKSSSGISLNDTLMVGPVIQDDLVSSILRFRYPRYVITGDIKKMFRQIWIRPDDQKYLRLFNRNDAGVIDTYQLPTETFGLASASFLAIRTIHKLTEDEYQKFPKEAESLKNSLYVDDLLDGTDTMEETIELLNQIIQLLKAGGFNLRQCTSNSLEVLKNLPEPIINKQMLDKSDPQIKTLGVFWN